MVVLPTKMEVLGERAQVEFFGPTECKCSIWKDFLCINGTMVVKERNGAES